MWYKQAQERKDMFASEVDRLKNCNHETNAFYGKLSKLYDSLTADLRKFKAAQVYALLY